MFQTNTCPLCCGGLDVGSPRHQFVLPGCDAISLVNHHNKTQSLSGGSVKMRHGRIDGNSDFGPNTTAFLPGSLHSRESGFQSFASSMSSVCSRVQVLKLYRFLYRICFVLAKRSELSPKIWRKIFPHASSQDEYNCYRINVKKKFLSFGLYQRSNNIVIERQLYETSQFKKDLCHENTILLFGLR